MNSTVCLETLKDWEIVQNGKKYQFVINWKTKAIDITAVNKGVLPYQEFFGSFDIETFRKSWNIFSNFELADIYETSVLYSIEENLWEINASDDQGLSLVFTLVIGKRVQKYELSLVKLEANLEEVVKVLCEEMEKVKAENSELKQKIDMLIKERGERTEKLSNSSSDHSYPSAPLTANLQHPIMEVDHLKGMGSSIITSSEEIKLLSSWISQNKKRFIFKKLYTASRNGDGTADFHSHCDNKGPTVTLIQTINGHRFGGLRCKIGIKAGSIKPILKRVCSLWPVERDSQLKARRNLPFIAIGITAQHSVLDTISMWTRDH